MLLGGGIAGIAFIFAGCLEKCLEVCKLRIGERIFWKTILPNYIFLFSQ